MSSSLRLNASKVRSLPNQAWLNCAVTGTAIHSYRRARAKLACATSLMSQSEQRGLKDRIYHLQKYVINPSEIYHWWLGSLAKPHPCCVFPAACLFANCRIAVSSASDTPKSGLHYNGLHPLPLLPFICQLLSSLSSYSLLNSFTILPQNYVVLLPSNFLTA